MANGTCSKCAEILSRPRKNAEVLCDRCERLWWNAIQEIYFRKILELGLLDKAVEIIEE